MIFFLLNQRKQTSSDVNLNAVLLKWIDRGSSCRDVVVFFSSFSFRVFFLSSLIRFVFFCFFFWRFSLGDARGLERLAGTKNLFSFSSSSCPFRIFVSFLFLFHFIIFLKIHFHGVSRPFFSRRPMYRTLPSREPSLVRPPSSIFFFLRYLFCGIFLALIRLSTSVVSTRFLDIDVTDDLMKRERCNEMTQN